MILPLISLIIVFTLATLADNLPRSLPRCPLDDPKVGNCIISAANSLRSRLEEGINEIGVPSYKPLTLTDIYLYQDSPLLNFTCNTDYMKIRGIDNFDLTEIDYDPENKTFKGKLELDSVVINGLHNISGRFLFIPIKGHGKFQLDFAGINATFEILGDVLQRRNLDHYQPKDIKIRLHINEGQAYFDNLFDGDKELGDTTNILINQNAATILEAGTPVFEALAEQFIMRYFKWLTRKYPFYELFPRS